MAIKLMPTRKDLYSYEYRVDLDGVIYTISIRYNTRMGRYIMDVKSSDDVNICMGIPVLLGTLLLKRFSKAELPEGDMFVMNSKDENSDAGDKELGENVLLAYNEAT